MNSRILVGCAGWTIPRDAAFPEQGSHLERYASVFGCVEINSSFYRPHQASTYARWAASVPDGFRFSVKLPRAITHDARLVGCDEQLDQFAGQAGALGNKLGCVLVQLPPKLAFDSRVAAQFIARMKGRFDCTLALEARHPAWFDEAATALLTEQGVTRVIADPPKGQDGPHRPTTATIYARLHGVPRIYYSSYAPDYLAQLGRDLALHAAAGRTVWTIFDNTASGAAVQNALDVLRAL
jgi:uncharacterized protein YecE (DUF72 family)